MGLIDELKSKFVSADGTFTRPTPRSPRARIPSTRPSRV